MMIDDVGTRASLCVLIVPFEGIHKGIADRDSRIGTAGTSHDLRAAGVIIDDDSSGLLLVAKLLGEGLVEKIDGSNGRAVTILRCDYLNDLVCVMNIVILSPGGIQCILA